MSLWIKICGTTTLPDAELAVDAGADAIGFVFAASPRRVTPEQVAAITSRLPQTVEKIGVFSEMAIDEIASAVLTSGLSGVQLHFDAAPLLTAQLRDRFGGSLRVVRVVRFKTESPATALELLDDPSADAILVDSCSKTGAGGTGIAYDWDLAAETIFRTGASRKFIAAGGLNDANIAAAIARLRPWGVDVATGVESAPGRKDPAKIRAFIAGARAAAGK
ncbi:MAG TPA: phosphoribosylanthranilate isomerase [Terracidiphilus sp.]|nr:phosphoribosylanthranilate isomerase [Terracidiphilus sp.]